MGGTRYNVDTLNAERDTHPAFPERGPMAFVPVPEVGRAALARGRTIHGRGGLVEAFGGDAAKHEPAAWYWTPVYAHRPGHLTRYLPAACLEHLDELAAASR